MPRFARDHLVTFALHALEDAHRQCEDAAIAGTWPLRFLLAFLASEAEERWPFDHWWRTAREMPGHMLAARFGRQQSLNSALAGIYLQVGRVRER